MEVANFVSIIRILSIFKGAKRVERDTSSLYFALYELLLQLKTLVAFLNSKSTSKKMEIDLGVIFNDSSEIWPQISQNVETKSR